MSGSPVDMRPSADGGVVTWSTSVDPAAVDMLQPVSVDKNEIDVDFGIFLVYVEVLQVCVTVFFTEQTSFVKPSCSKQTSN